jgi:hypothetical protein
MISSEVQRTLVKSPPELWAEISDPASLARHLGEFGEIRITRVEPEQRVEWEAGDASGSVVIKPSGWGTKVKLTVTRELAPLDGTSDSAPDADADADDSAQAEADAALAAREPDVVPDDEPEAEAPVAPETEATVEPEPEAAVEPEVVEPEVAEPEPVEPELVGPELVEPELVRPESVEPEDAEPAADEQEPHGEAEQPSAPEPRRGFFARLFGRRRATRVDEPTVEDDAEGDPSESGLDERADEPYNALSVWASQMKPDGADDGADDGAWASASAAVVEDEAVPALAGPGDVSEPSVADSSESREDAPAPAEAPADISAEIAAAEEVAAEQVTAVLTGVLDRLGAAHHRPFSRS